MTPPISSYHAHSRCPSEVWPRLFPGCAPRRPWREAHAQGGDGRCIDDVTRGRGRAGALRTAEGRGRRPEPPAGPGRALRGDGPETAPNRPGEVGTTRLWVSDLWQRLPGWVICPRRFGGVSDIIAYCCSVCLYIRYVEYSGYTKSIM